MKNKKEKWISYTACLRGLAVKRPTDQHGSSSISSLDGQFVMFISEHALRLIARASKSVCRCPARSMAATASDITTLWLRINVYLSLFVFFNFVRFLLDWKEEIAFTLYLCLSVSRLTWKVADGSVKFGEIACVDTENSRLTRFLSIPQTIDNRTTSLFAPMNTVEPAEISRRC